VNWLLVTATHQGQVQLYGQYLYHTSLRDLKAQKHLQGGHETIPNHAITLPCLAAQKRKTNHPRRGEKKFCFT
jgi:hypothetical protein